MSRYYFFGGLSIGGGVLLVLFQAISSMMARDIVWKKISLVDVVDTRYLKWVDGISWDMIQDPIQYIIGMPLYLLLVVVGILLFIIGGLVAK